MRTLILLALLALGATVSGCVALPVVAPAAMSAGGDLVKAGTVRTFGGATFRTFGVPLSELYAATRTTLDRLGFARPDEESVEERVTLHVAALDRSIRIDLQPITGGMTQMRVFVRKNMMGKDLATASELVAQVELTLEPSGERLAQRKVSDRRARVK
jgi:hypothetical protein